jgi:transmembrane sensor
VKGVDVSVRYQKDQTELDRIYDVAIAWQTRLASSATLAADYEAFSRWIGEDRRHADAFGRAERAAMMIERARAACAVDATPRRFPSAMAENDNGGLRRASIAAGVAIIAAAALVFVYSRAAGVEAVASAAPAGKIVTAALSDGTQITLAPDAAFEGSFTRWRREITSLRGTSYFSVTHDSKRPFVIALGERTITVIGTKFEVRSTEASQSVTVLEGIVSVKTVADGGFHERRLTAGERATYSEGSPEAVLDRADLNDVAEWRDGTLEFDRADARAITEELNAFYGHAAFAVDPASPPVLSFSGALSLSDPRTTARRLEELAPVIAHEADGAIFLSRP